MILHEELITAMAAAHLVLLLGISSFTDLTAHKIPNALLLPGLAIALLIASFGYGAGGVAASVCGLLVGLASGIL